jgi:hypothetical protein
MTPVEHLLTQEKTQFFSDISIESNIVRERAGYQSANAENLVSHVLVFFVKNYIVNVCAI